MHNYTLSRIWISIKLLGKETINHKIINNICVGYPRTYGHLIFNKQGKNHSSVLAWRIPGTEEPGRRPSVGLHRVGHD